MKAAILRNREFAPLSFHLAVAIPSPSPPLSRGRDGKGTFHFSPGQFAMIGFGVVDPFLPRALSIYRATCQSTVDSRQSPVGGVTHLEFLYKVIGRGSAYLSRLRKGQTVELLAPLGRGFMVPEELQTAILVAGGIGVPPIVALAESIAGRTSQISMVAFIGGRSREDVLCVRDFKRAGAEVHPVTENGSMGQKGLVPNVLDQYLLIHGPWPQAVIYACGPNAMLAAVASVALKHGLPCQVSMEATMACGFGICMGCAIPVKPSAVSCQPSASYKLCCQDGPVFKAQEITW